MMGRSHMTQYSWGVVRGYLAELSSLLVPHETQELSSDPQTWLCLLDNPKRFSYT